MPLYQGNILFNKGEKTSDDVLQVKGKIGDWDFKILVHFIVCDKESNESICKEIECIFLNSVLVYTGSAPSALILSQAPPP